MPASTSASQRSVIARRWSTRPARRARRQTPRAGPRGRYPPQDAGSGGASGLLLVRSVRSRLLEQMRRRPSSCSRADKGVEDRASRWEISALEVSTPRRRRVAARGSSRPSSQAAAARSSNSRSSSGSSVPTTSVRSPSAAPRAHREYPGASFRGALEQVGASVPGPGRRASPPRSGLGRGAPGRAPRAAGARACWMPARAARPGRGGPRATPLPGAPSAALRVLLLDPPAPAASSSPAGTGPSRRPARSGRRCEHVDQRGRT